MNTWYCANILGKNLLPGHNKTLSELSASRNIISFYPSRTIICDLPWQNQPYCTDNRFLVKATITKYNLWTIAPANLKSLACVVMDIWAKMYPDRP